MVFSGNFESYLNMYDLYKTLLNIYSRRFDDSDGKGYYYGWAMSLLLDKLCGDIWKIEILEKGVYLDDLLAKYSKYDKNSRKKYL